MELKDTINNMTSDNYKERFIAEYCQAKIRYNKLGRFVGKIKYAKFTGAEEPKHDCPEDILEKQLYAMGVYIKALEIRAEQYENIELPKIEEVK